MSQPQGELYDIGYQHYDGPREGRMRARKAVWVNGLRTVLGLGRPLLAKLFPLLFFGFVVLFAVIITIIIAVTGDLDVEDTPGPADFYQVVSFFLILFSAVAAPELLCPDRRDGVINLYLVRPLTPIDYVSARWLVFFVVVLVILYTGQVVLLGGSVLAADKPIDYLRDNWLDVPRFLAAGVVYAVFAATIPLAAAAFTTRRTYAAAFVVALFIFSSVAAAALTGCDEEHDQAQDRFGPQAPVECNPITGDSAKWYNLAGIIQAPIHMNDLIFDKQNDGLGFDFLRELPAPVPVLWYLLLVLGPGAAIWWRYRRIAS